MLILEEKYQQTSKKSAATALFVQNFYEVKYVILSICLIKNVLTVCAEIFEDKLCNISEFIIAIFIYYFVKYEIGSFDWIHLIFIKIVLYPVTKPSESTAIFGFFVNYLQTPDLNLNPFIIQEQEEEEEEVDNTLLCKETIPGSPTPYQDDLNMIMELPPSNSSSTASSSSSTASHTAHAVLDNTPPTTPESSLSPPRK